MSPSYGRFREIVASYQNGVIRYAEWQFRADKDSATGRLSGTDRIQGYPISQITVLTFAAGTLFAPGGERFILIEPPSFSQTRETAKRTGRGGNTAAPIFDEIMLIINVNGINGTTIEGAQECRKRGLKSIGIGSKQLAENVEPDCGNRHPCGKNLHDLVDLHLDCHTPVGDMIVDLKKIGRKTGSSSTCPLVLIVQLLNTRTIELLVEQGFTPDFFMSGNTKEGMPFGKKLKDRWFSRIKHM